MNSTLNTTVSPASNGSHLTDGFDLDSWVLETVNIIQLNLKFNNILFTVRCIGIVLNAIALRVLLSKEMKSTATTYLIMLVCFDSVFLTCYCVNNIFVFLDICLVKPSSWVLEVGILAAINLGACGSILTTMTLTLERYIAIAYPLKVKILCSGMSKSLILCLEFVLACIITGIDAYQMVEFILPLGKTLGLKEALNNDNETRASLSKFPMVLLSCVYIHEDTFSLTEDFPIVQNTLLYVLPTCVLFVLNIMIVRALRRACPITSSRDPDREFRKRLLLKSVLAISTMSMIAYPISFVSTCLNTYAPEIYVSFDTMIFIEDMVHALNSSVNCIFYCLISKRFRNLLLEILGCCRKKTTTNNLRLGSTNPCSSQVTNSSSLSPVNTPEYM